MKRTLTTFMLAVGMVGVFVATPLSAQSHTGVAEIPFSFVMSGKTLPAGKYNISQFSGNSSLFTVQNADGRALFEDFGARHTGHPNNPSITFKKVEGQWVMYEIAPPNSQTAYSLGEKALAKNRKLELATMVSSIKLR